MDPLAPNYPELTSYQFASNRPIDGIDKDGTEYEYYLKKYLYDVWGFDHTKNKDDKYVKQWMSQKTIEFGDLMKKELVEGTERLSESPLMIGMMVMVAAPFVLEIGSTASASSSYFSLSSMARTAAINSSINFAAQYATNGFQLKEVDFADVAVSGGTALIPGGRFSKGLINPNKVFADALLGSTFDVKISGSATIFDNKTGKEFAVDFVVGLALNTLGDFSDDILKGAFSETRYIEFLGKISDDNLRAIFQGAGKEGTEKILQESLKAIERYGANELSEEIKE